MCLIVKQFRICMLIIATVGRNSATGFGNTTNDAIVLKATVKIGGKLEKKKETSSSNYFEGTL